MSSSALLAVVGSLFVVVAGLHPPALPFAGSLTGATTPAMLVLFVTNVANCKCTPTVHNEVNDTTANCGNSPGNPPTIFVTVPDKQGSDCDPGPTNCVAIPNHNCTATVKAELQWPTNPCFSSGSVTGPGIGTDDTPCQATSAPNNVAVTWNLTAACTPTGGATIGTPSFKVWFTACVGGQPPGGSPAMEYQPRLNCSACTP